MASYSAIGTKRKKMGEQVTISEDLGNCAREVIDAINRRAFEIFEAQDGKNGCELDHWLQAESELLYPLQLNIEDMDSALVVRGELRDFNPGEFELKVEPRLLTIVGKRDQSQDRKDKSTSSNSNNARRIFMTLVLPEQVQCEYAAAHLSGGTLEVILPKLPKSSEPATSAD